MVSSYFCSSLIELENYILLNPPIDRKDILNEKYKNELLGISKNSEVFFNNKLDLRQGAYLTPCSLELLSLINEVYFKLSSSKLPFTDEINFNLTYIFTCFKIRY